MATRAGGTDRPVLLLTGAGGALGTAVISAAQARYDIVAVSHGSPVQGASQRQSFIDPARPQRILKINDRAPFEVVADITEADATDRVIDLALARFGRVDVLINAAGRGGSGHLTSSRVIEDAAAVFELNAIIPARLARGLAERCWRLDRSGGNGRRCIINVSSISSLDMEQARGFGIFAASKAALNVLTCELAADLAPLGVRVNAVAPPPFPSIVPAAEVAQRILALVEGHETGRILVMWDDADELI